MQEIILPCLINLLLSRNFAACNTVDRIYISQKNKITKDHYFKIIFFTARNRVELGACGFHLHPWHAWYMVRISSFLFLYTVKKLFWRIYKAYKICRGLISLHAAENIHLFLTVYTVRILNIEY
jgi:hypothetical protein